ncbi:hypothetical protein Fcan01_13145 [Folsomia candida]|uniref:Uncharacterized protein n=1 Tax=Folsomia candida TaxID=158441 RepID=A0A226E553_FOLCA|nr:hypothetical protein Fcan01_13145 [Folsomia candida]
MSANSNADLEQVSLSDMAFMGVWSIFGISYVFIFVYCTLILSAIIILFEQVEKMMKANFLLWTSYRGGGGSNKPISVTDSSTDPEVQLYYAQEKFEETVQLFNEFQNSFGFKLLICVTKVCFSTFLTFRLLILVMKVKVGGESSSLFQVTVLHTSHLWGLLFLLSLCNNAKNMASKANACLESVKPYKIIRTCPHRMILVMAAVIISYSVVLENFSPEQKITYLQFNETLSSP